MPASLPATTLYTAPHQLEPLMPRDVVMEPLLAQAHALTAEALTLAGRPVAREVRGLLRAMNSYYTHRIEGQHTRPLDIERALHKDFSSDRQLAARQRLALAHIQSEAALEARPPAGSGAPWWSADALRTIHQDLFERLPAEDRVTDEGEPIVPGQWRLKNVEVGRHVAPAFDSVPSFLARWSQVYGGVRPGEASLLAVAAAHHRLGWIHPFVDGNGRVMRLHTHLMLHGLGYTGGLWSPLRGFARDVDRYCAQLAAADEPRRGDLDGRGNLTEAGLSEWIAYVLAVCTDQVRFMRGMLDLEQIEGRIAACLAFETHQRTGARMEALRPLHYLFLSGAEMERGEFKAMTGLGDRTAVTLLGALVKRGLLVSDTPNGKVRFGVPQHALRFYFPALWPEAEQDAAAGG